MVLDKKKAYRNLKKKGFVDSSLHGRDHKYLEYYHDGKYILHTKISHGGKDDLENYLIKQMSMQCKLTKQQFEDLVNCPLSKNDYLKILQDSGML